MTASATSRRAPAGTDRTDRVGGATAPDAVGRRRVLTRLVIAALALGAVSVWGLAAPAGPVGLGVPVAVPGGTLTADRVGDVDLSLPMSGPGMSMPMGRGVPDIPEGARRVEVDVTLRADAGGALWLRAEDVSVTGPGVPPTAAIFTEDAGTFVPPGGALTRTLTFEIPADAAELSLTSEGADGSISIHLGPAPDGHGH